MTRKTILVSGIVAAVLYLGNYGSAQESLSLKTQRQKVSYGIGVQFAKDLENRGIRTDIGTKTGQQGDEVEFEMIVRGMRDALSGKKLLVSERELHRALFAFQSDLRRKQMRTGMTPADTNRQDGEAFLTNNKTKEGVIALPNGLQYRILKAAGEGRKPVDGDTVEVIWQSSHIDGSEIEGAVTGGPRIAKISGDVIPGLAQALKLMTVGSKWRLFIPPPLAYGGQGNGSTIGPNETVIYDVELVSIR
jgi:FKBP-type peptidyl-prolyl cis-trans isomerase